MVQVYLGPENYLLNIVKPYLITQAISGCLGTEKLDVFRKVIFLCVKCKKVLRSIKENFYFKNTINGVN